MTGLQSLIVVWAVAFVLSCCSFPSAYGLNKLAIVAEKRFGIDTREDGDLMMRTAAPEFPILYGRFRQVLDHFADDGAAPTFKQRFMVADKFYKPGGPVFVNLGGEWKSGAWEVKSGTVIHELARRHGGMLVNLEHRYYGLSAPPPEMDGSLPYLSITQAVEDIRAFQLAAPSLPQFAKYQLSSFPDTKWIFVGGSYAGELALRYTATYPELVSATWASSSPTQSTGDYFLYDRLMRQWVQCPDYIHSVIQQVDRALDQAVNATQRNRIMNKFHPQMASSMKSRVAFLYMITDLLAYSVQFGFPAPDDVFGPLCAKEFSSVSDIDNLAGSVKYILSEWEMTPSDADMFAQTGVDPNMRGFVWQQCHGTGYFQTADPERPLRSPKIIFNVMLNEICVRMFRQTAEEFVQLGEELAEQRDLLENQLRALNVPVIVTHGRYDPWSAAGPANPVPLDNEASVRAVPKRRGFQAFITDSFHCDDLFLESYAPEADHLKNAVFSLMDYYINQ